MPGGYFALFLIAAGLLLVFIPRRSIPAMLSPAEDESDTPWAARTSTRIRVGGVFAIALGLILLAAGS